MSKVKAVPAKYKTTDGQEFELSADATRHQAVVDALEQYNTAMRALARATVQAMKTADGFPFEFGSSKDYYIVVETYADWPRVHKLQFWGWYCQKFSMNDRGELQIAQGQTDKERWWSVGELYASEAAARKECRRRREERLELFRKEMEDES